MHADDASGAAQHGVSPHDASVDVEGGIVEIRTTFAARGAAEACARLLVERGLAACVQVDGPVLSTYRWRGAVERAEEFRCTAKTTAAAAGGCIEAIRRAHPYENPELLVAAVAAAPAYAAWVRESVGAGAGAGGSP
jgi:periplasmic divalent cation tolerance protein